MKSKVLIWVGRLLFYLSVGVLLFLLIEPSSSEIKVIPLDLFFGILTTGAIFGILIYRLLYSVHLSYIDNLDKIAQEKNFEIIFSNVKLISFNKRIGDLIFFDYTEYTLVYNIKKQQFFVFKNEDCILTSQNIADSKPVTSLKDHLHANFGHLMNDCIVINGILYSKNLFQTQNQNARYIPDLEKMRELYDQFQHNKVQPEIILEIDEILDKINKHGMNSLTKEELDFLKNQK